jgi:hypothetical protein
MRTFIKGFVATSIVSAGFLCGLTSDVLTTAVHNPRVGSIIPAVPASRVAQLLQPAAARAADGETYPAPADQHLQLCAENDPAGLL